MKRGGVTKMKITWEKQRKAQKTVGLTKFPWAQTSMNGGGLRQKEYGAPGGEEILSEGWNGGKKHKLRIGGRKQKRIASMGRRKETAGKPSERRENQLKYQNQ